MEAETGSREIQQSILFVTKWRQENIELKGGWRMKTLTKVGINKQLVRLRDSLSHAASAEWSAKAGQYFQGWPRPSKH